MFCKDPVIIVGFSSIFETGEVAQLQGTCQSPAPHESQPAGLQSLTGFACFDLEISRINWVVPSWTQLYVEPVC